MTTSNEPTTPTRLRLTLSAAPGTGALDGGWWPRTTDLDVELADLVDHFPPEAGRIARAVYSRPDWTSRPRTVKVARGTLKTGSFPRDDTHVLVVSLATGERLTLLVVPPGTPPDDARELVRVAAEPTNLRAATELRAAAAAR
jgi:hypothetical protein